MPKPTSHRAYVSGKGDWRREAQISDEEMQKNWNEIFGKKTVNTITVDLQAKDVVNMMGTPEGEAAIQKIVEKNRRLSGEKTILSLPGARRPLRNHRNRELFGIPRPKSGLEKIKDGLSAAMSPVDKIRAGLERGEHLFLTWLGPKKIDSLFTKRIEDLRSAFMAGRASK